MFGLMKPRQPAPEPAPRDPRPGVMGGALDDMRQIAGSRGADKLAAQMAVSAASLNGDLPAFAADSVDGIKSGFAIGQSGAPDILLDWFASQGFIGYSACAILATNWLIGQCCEMPARDAVRKGYVVAAEDGDLPEDIAKLFAKADRRYKIEKQLVEFVEKGRTFGIRIALPVIDTSDQDTYYENPFNPDGITPGSYRGIVQVDPQWCSPVLDPRGVSDPATFGFYEPTWWLIGGRKYHKSHLIIFRNGEVPDLLKPAYRYGGVPVPQRIMERVYCAERTANEAPQLVMTKRLTTFGTDTTAMAAGQGDAENALRLFARLRDNFGVKVYDKEAEEVGQYDTALGDLDAVIMTQYQLVAAAANVPATKLLGTTPKGFNATGEYEEAAYREELESIQAHDLTRLLERHHLCVMRSDIAPTLEGGKPVATTIVWNPLDSPTAEEMANRQKVLADRDAVLSGIGAVDGVDVRARIARDPDSGYYGVDVPEAGGETEEEQEEIPGDIGAESGDEPLPAASLNGAQIESMVEVVQSVAAGTLPYDSGVAILMLAFQLKREDAEAVMGARPAPAAPIENQAAQATNATPAGQT